jgi:hypothetical protein
MDTDHVTTTVRHGFAAGVLLRWALSAAWQTAGRSSRITLARPASTGSSHDRRD